MRAPLTLKLGEEILVRGLSRSAPGHKVCLSDCGARAGIWWRPRHDDDLATDNQAYWRDRPATDAPSVCRTRQSVLSNLYLFPPCPVPLAALEEATTLKFLRPGVLIAWRFRRSPKQLYLDRYDRAHGPHRITAVPTPRSFAPPLNTPSRGIELGVSTSSEMLRLTVGAQGVVLARAAEHPMIVALDQGNCARWLSLSI